MAQLPPQLQDNFAHLLRTKGKSIDTGIMAANHKERERYWQHWSDFIAPFHHMDPKLTNIPTTQCIELITAFAEHVRHGSCSCGQQVRAGTIQVAVCAIGKTFEMDRHPNPLYHAEGRYWLPLKHQIEGYQHQDPPSQCKLAVPISLIEYLVQLGASSNSPKLQATCDACTIAFYYLLRIGKYTSHHCNDCCHTQQF